MYRTEEAWIEAYQALDAYWLHDGKPGRPHALLTSGLHSDGFFNSKPVIADDRLLKEAAADLAELLFDAVNIWTIDRVVGPQTGATKLAEYLADAIGVRRGRECFWASPAKAETDGKKSMAFESGKPRPVSGELVLLCEDVITTGGSVSLADAATRDCGAKTMGALVALVNRSGEQTVAGKAVLPLIGRKMSTWKTNDCPLCETGSEAIRPKEGDNWKLLNA